MGNHAELLELCHRLGDPNLDLAIGAEGNVSMRIDHDGMVIKASGCSLAAMTSQDIVDVDRSVLLTLLTSEPTDEHTRAVYASAKRTETERIPSVEAILHAVLYDVTNAAVIAHTHPIAVNMLTCSKHPELLVEGSLFPDAIVVMGSRQLLIPYTDPGVPLAHAVREGVIGFQETEHTDPRVIYLANHGLFVLASSPQEAWTITEMAVKNAKILHGTLAAGGPNFLPPHHVHRIDRRPDELYRRQKLS